MKYFIVGYMASGKTTYARNLALRKGLRFVDLDQAVEERAGCGIPELFAARGEACFRELERQLLCEMGESGDDFVMATGGGTPCFFDNMDYMNSRGETIFLDTPVDILVERLRRERFSRPLLASLADDEVQAFIVRHRASRLPFYLKAKQKIG